MTTQKPLSIGISRCDRREFIGGVLACAAAGCATSDVAWRPSERWRGFNLLGMFVKRAAAKDASGPRFREEDFALIAEWGFNFVRLPLDYRYWIRGNDWKAIDDAALAPLDAAIDLGQRYGLHVQICLHRAPGFCINPPPERADLFTDAEAFDAMATHWRHLATRYRHIPTDALSFDMLNEPSFHSEKEISAVLGRMLDVIHDVDERRFVIADGCDGGWHPLPGLFGRRNLGFSMRGYAPFGLSHYKADWAKDPPSEVPVWPPDGSASGREWFEKNVFCDWRETLERGEFLMANEFGCFRHTPHAVALAWMKDMLDLWREKGIGWALWNFTGPFGVLDSRREDVDYENFRGHLLDRKMLELLQNS